MKIWPAFLLTILLGRPAYELPQTSPPSSAVSLISGPREGQG
jgi:hypothetical protein